MTFRFAEPLVLLLLLVIPLLAWWRGRGGRDAAVRFPSTLLLHGLGKRRRASRGQLLLALRWLGMALLILALARPQTGGEVIPEKSRGIDIMLVTDLSTSMWAHDFKVDSGAVDRLTVVKRVLDDFVGRRETDRLGLLVFAGEPYLASPLTLNHAYLRQRIANLKIGLPEDGTAIGSALALAAERLADLDVPSRVVILLTDGANNRGTLQPLQAAEAAKALGIRVYTIGVGREGIVPMPRLDRRGQPVRDARGDLIFVAQQSDVDFASLKAIADQTGGRYYHATDTQELERIYAEIDQLERTEKEITARRLYREAFVWFLGPALAFLGLELLLGQTLWRRLP